MSFEVSASMGKDYFLRNYYGTSRDLRKKTIRMNTSNRQKSVADTSALKNALKDLEKVDYDNTDKDEDLYNKFYAFINTYNNTIESTGKESSEEMKHIQKKLKQVTSKYKTELEELDIKINEDGTLEIGENTEDRFTINRMKGLFGEKDGIYGKNLLSIAKKMNIQAGKENEQSGGFNAYA